MQEQGISSKRCVPIPDATWETAVIWLRQQADQQELVRACYFDDPLEEAARRFADSEEWKALRKLLPPVPAAALDLGAGRGISSYALARDGWNVTALEPDPSPLVGAGAIRRLAKESGLSIAVVEDYCEEMPFCDNEFDLVHGRQVLHHAKNLDSLCREVYRVLKPHGRFVATREHVIGSPADLQAFLDSHPLHWLYGGESAYPLREYVSAIAGSGLRLFRTLGPYDSPINYAPMTHDEWVTTCSRPLTRIIGAKATRLLASNGHVAGRCLLKVLSALRTRLSNTPGRLYSFIAEKP
jgi:SAM-dependent methyltransferase